MIRQSSPGLGPNQLTSERYSMMADVCVCVCGEKRGSATLSGSNTEQKVPHEHQCT